MQGFKSRGTKIKGRQDAVTNLYDSGQVSYSIGSLGTGDSEFTSDRKRKKRAVPQSCYDRVIAPYIFESECKGLFTPSSSVDYRIEA